MSQRVTPSTTQTTTPTQVPHDKIAMRAYEKWCKRGCPPGTDKSDWMEAEMELARELNRTQHTGHTPR